MVRSSSQAMISASRGQRTITLEEHADNQHRKGKPGPVDGFSFHRTANAASAFPVHR